MGEAYIFPLFGIQHISFIIGGIIALFVALALANVNPRIVLRVVAFVTLFTKIAELIYRHIAFKTPIIDLLPLHLCNITLILAIILFLTDFKPLFQIVYFWSVGAIFAIATPDVVRPFPNFATISFFLTHFFVLFAPIVCITVLDYRPRFLGWFSSLVLMVGVIFGVHFLNTKLGTNYLYISKTPDFASLISILGTWPRYVYVEYAIFFVITLIMYLPFRPKKKRKYY